MQIFKKLLDGCSDGICIVDDTELIYANRRLQAITGYTAAELSEVTLETLIAPADHTRVTERLTRVVEAYTSTDGRDDAAETLTVGVAHKDDTHTTSHLTISAGVHNNRTVCALRFCESPDAAADCEELTVLKERFELAVQGAGVGLWDYNMQTDEVIFNEQWASMLGCQLAEIEPTVDAWTKRTHPEDAKRVWAAVDAHEAGETSHYDCEQRMKTADGDWKWIRTLGKIIERTEDGEPLRAVGLHIDIDAAKQNEVGLEVSHNQLRQIIDLVPDLLFVKNREGTYLLANDKTAEAYGLTREGLEGNREVDVLPEAAQSTVFRKDDLAVIESGQPKEIEEEELTTADGERRIFRTTKIPYTLSETDEDAVLGYARDITAVKEYERQLETQRDNLNILNEVMRHDIRNDLQLVTAYAEMLEESASLTDVYRSYLKKIQKAAENAIDLTTAAGELSAVMLQQNTELTAVGLETTLEAQLERIRSSRQAVELTVGPIPSVDVYADELLSAVFRNLLGNALAHNRRSRPEITVETQRDEDVVTVQIADNGRGVPDSQKAAIFGRGNKGLESEGTGIGLYLVKSLVDRYGGAVWVEDNDPEGAIFCVELRRA